jgi:predicted transposase YbfD/YdcC
LFPDGLAAFLFGGSPRIKKRQDSESRQREIVKKIVKKAADYVIAVNKNQPSLYEQVEQLFKQAIKTRGDSLKMSSFNSKETNRGREEIRNYLMISDIAMSIDPLQKWQNLTSIGLVESVRVVDGKASVETRYFISSLNDNVEKLAEAIRSHWSIENSLHWVLDVTFQEDNSRIRKDNAPANFAVLRQIAVNILVKIRVEN